MSLQYCLKAFPDIREKYEANKQTAKDALKDPMRRLRTELQKDKIRAAFFSKALFNSAEVNYLSIRDDNEIWHIFPAELVIKEANRLEIANSKARHSGKQTTRNCCFEPEPISERLKQG